MIASTLQVLLLPLSLAAALMTLYLLVLTAAAWSHPGRLQIHGTYHGDRHPKHRFLLLIPAHNEEMLLGEMLRGLRRHSYPESHYEIVVIADNCDDRTAFIAGAARASVLVRNDPDSRGKGQALNWAMTGPLRAWERPYDAVVVLDADSWVNRDFLWFLDRALARGHELLQGYYGVLNPQDSWRTSLLTASLAAFHFLRPLGRDRLGLSCGLKGNGMCFSRRLVDTYGYPAFSVVEDLELALFFLQEGLTVTFVPGAQIYGQMARSGRDAHTQRVRWEGGRFALLRQWAGRLLLDGLRRRSAARIDGALDLVIPPFTILAAGTAALLCATLLLRLFGQAPPANLNLTLCAFAAASQAVYLLSSLRLTRAPGVIYKRLLFAPVFVLWKLGLYGRMMLRRKPPGAPRWVRTGRHQVGQGGRPIGGGE